MQKLTDILKNGSADTLRKQWADTEPAREFEALPAGEYVARIVGGELTTSKTNGTLGYSLAFRVLEGEHKGRQFWHTSWLTPNALQYSKRDLMKIGIVDIAQLEQPLPAGIRCRVKLALRRDDNDAVFNKVREFAVEGIDTPEPDAFAPPAAKTSDEGDVDGV